MVNLWLIMVNLWIIYDISGFFFITTEACSPEPWFIMVYFREIMPEIMAELFRLVNYYNLPRKMFKGPNICSKFPVVKL